MLIASVYQSINWLIADVVELDSQLSGLFDVVGESF